MLNITKNTLHKEVDLKEYESGRKVFHEKHNTYFNLFLKIFAIIGIIILFLPWTQTVSGKGNVTTLKPEHRPQTIQSPIPGQITQWYVNEGDYVKKGDTILRIAEVKGEYLDPDLVERTGEQVRAMSNSLVSYDEKIEALGQQVRALQQEKQLKLEQAQNKLRQSVLKARSDSIDLQAAETNLSIAETQLKRTQQLQQEGLKAMTDVEEKRLKLQETQAKLISQENKLLASKNDIINARLELNRIEAEYSDKISKARSDRSTAQSMRYETEAEVSKLKTAYVNYDIRDDLYFIKAPQNGYINKAIIGGIGETFKEGQKLVSIMPSDYELAVETFVTPLDLPLLHVGEEVRIRFDGWPAIVFSGWPNVSYGTYGGEIVAIENYISANGKYRVLLAPDPEEHEWPDALRVGSGATTLALLEDVPIWYEIWRHLNGFPPNYYIPESKNTGEK